MDKRLQQIRDRQQAIWNQSAPGWEKWDHFTKALLGSTSEAMIRLLQPEPGQAMLDIASGTGEPALSIAPLLSPGKLVLTDLSENMLEAAKRAAAARNIHNLEFRVCDVSALPFDDNLFDAVSCRMGLMFFPDPLLALREIIRVLRPGGKLVMSVWQSRDKNDWVGLIMDVTGSYSPSLVNPDAPGLFRFAAEGKATILFRSAGLQNIKEETVRGYLSFSDAETYWNYHTEVAAPLRALLEGMDDELKNRVRSEVIKRFNEEFIFKEKDPGYTTSVIYAEK